MIFFDFYKSLFPKKVPKAANNSPKRISTLDLQGRKYSEEALS
jgi:hypothetical protein